MGGIISKRNPPPIALSEEILRGLMDEFNHFDEDKKGVINFKQFQKLLERRVHMNRIKIEENSQMIQTTQQEILQRVRSTQSSQDRQMAIFESERAFQAADRERKGVLSFDDFARWQQESLATKQISWLDRND
mmetsp:Transcript_46645/g.95408  ORF Transcript_46645/g.95408 Transcript_46645/m.95408 type:complete len:133 (-) Transcript_46645:390-788(-)